MESGVMGWRESKISAQQKSGNSQGKRTRQLYTLQMVRTFMVIVLVATSVVATSGVFGKNRVLAAPAAQGDQPSSGTLAIVGANGAQLYSSPGGNVTQQL